MKSCGLLVKLSRDHQKALAAVRTLQQDAAGSKPVEHAISNFISLWSREIAPHYQSEEEILLPDLAQKTSEGDALILMTLSDHVALRRLVRELARDPKQSVDRGLIAEIENRLLEHIRYEEETLFPALIEYLGRSRLGEIAKEMAANRPVCNCSKAV